MAKNKQIKKEVKEVRESAPYLPIGDYKPIPRFKPVCTKC
jgi:hypothetical protein